MKMIIVILKREILRLSSLLFVILVMAPVGTIVIAARFIADYVLRICVFVTDILNRLQWHPVLSKVLMTKMFPKDRRFKRSLIKELVKRRKYKAKAQTKTRS